ncbi:MAG: RNA polymerase sigma factor [Sporichthyaceae bacterium]
MQPQAPETPVARTAGPGLPAPRVPPPDDAALVDRLRSGDERAFAEVVATWSPMMLRVARSHLSTDASCEEVVQETWLAVVRGLAGFEGRSSLRTWVFRILTNLAKTRGVREARTVPMSSWGPDSDEPRTVDPDRFRGKGDAYPGHWTPLGSPARWEPGPEQSAVAAETRRLLADALHGLPERQRTVVTLRDVHGLDSDEVCGLLAVTAANQRVLLHRGRAKLRTVLEHYYRSLEEAQP